MKRVKYLFLVFIFFITTGFTNYDISMNIEKNKEMDLSIDILSDYLDEIENVISLLEDKNTGYEITRNDSNDKYGLKIYKHFDNIDNVSFGERSEEFNLLYLHNDDYNKEIETKMFNVDKQFDINRYAANFYIDISQLNINLSNAIITYTLTLPGNTESNNAQSVNEEGNVLTWNIGSIKTEIDFVFKLKSYDTIYYIVAIVFAIFLVFSIISNLFSKGDESNRDSQEKRKVSGPTELDRRIQNFTQNSLNKNINNNTSNYNNRTNNNMINNNNNLNNNNRNININSNNNVSNIRNENISVVNNNNLVNGIPLIKPDVNSELSQTKKQGIFDKLKKEDKSIGTLYDTNNIPSNEEFNKLINNVSNSNNSINTDSTINNGDNLETIDVKSVDKENSGVVPTVSVIKNQKLDVNNVTPNLNDMFEYEEPVSNESVEEESKEKTEIKDGPVIKFNNKEIVVKKNDKEE